MAERFLHCLLLSMKAIWAQMLKLLSLLMPWRHETLEGEDTTDDQDPVVHRLIRKQAKAKSIPARLPPKTQTSPLNRFRAAVSAVMAQTSAATLNSRWQKAAEVRGDKMAAACESLVVVMVGLPARGKSFITGALIRHLRLSGMRAQGFNAGQARRKAGGAGLNATFFSADNKDAKAERERLAMECTDMMLEWLLEGPGGQSSVAILDATNTTVARRRAVLERCQAAAHKMKLAEAPGLHILFLESMCDDPAVLAGNYEMKLENEDYKGCADVDQARADFRERVKAYERQYEPLEDSEIETLNREFTLPVGSLRIINGGLRIQTARLSMLATLRVAPLLSCMHLLPRQLIFVLEGSVDAKCLAALVKEAEETDDGRQADVLFGATKASVLVAERLELLLAGSSESPGSPKDLPLTPCGSRQPRSILTLRELEPRQERFSKWRTGTPSYSTSCHCRPSSLVDVPDETFADMMRRMHDVILFIERLPRSVIVVCPSREVRTIFLAHFHSCPEMMAPETLQVSRAPVIQLQRDHKGFSLLERHEHELPSLPELVPAPPPVSLLTSIRSRAISWTPGPSCSDRD